MAKNKLKKVANDSLVISLIKRKAKKKPHIALSFDSLVKKLREAIETFPDIRSGKNLSKKFEDAALGGFAVFFTQNPSFLAYQTTMQETKGYNNAQSLFGITEILSDNHIRNLLDGVAPDFVFPVFSYIFNVLNKSGYLDEKFCSFNNNIVISLDGTQYFSSKTIHCDNVISQYQESSKWNDNLFSYGCNSGDSQARAQSGNSISPGVYYSSRWS